MYVYQSISIPHHMSHHTHNAPHVTPHVTPHTAVQQRYSYSYKVLLSRKGYFENIAVTVTGFTPVVRILHISHRRTTQTFDKCNAPQHMCSLKALLLATTVVRYGPLPQRNSEPSRRWQFWRGATRISPSARCGMYQCVHFHRKTMGKQAHVSDV